MASKVLVKLPTVPFPQGKKSPSDIVALTEVNQSQVNRSRSMSIDRVAQLEQNMKFLQEQHQATLIALHQEVESLRQKNRDLQFQLVFSKGSAFVPSTPSSPEDNGTGFAKSKGSPVCVNVAPLQVELLEKDLQDTKTSLQEAKTENQYLSEIIEQQKKKLDLSEEEKNKPSVTDVGVQVGGRLERIRAELEACLEDAEAMVKRLRRQNEEHRREIATLKAAATPGNSAGPNRAGRSRDGNNSYHNFGMSMSLMQEQTSHKFPPLQSHSYWHRRMPSSDHSTGYHKNERSRHDKEDPQSEMNPVVLPRLLTDGMKNVIFDDPFYRSRGYRNHNRVESNRKYRGYMCQRDRQVHHH